MKKAAAILLTFVMLIGIFAGCKKDNTSSEPEKKGDSWVTASGDSVFNAGNQNSGGESSTNSDATATSSLDSGSNVNTSSQEEGSENNSAEILPSEGQITVDDSASDSVQSGTSSNASSQNGGSIGASRPTQNSEVSTPSNNNLGSSASRPTQSNTSSNISSQNGTSRPTQSSTVSSPSQNNSGGSASRPAQNNNSSNRPGNIVVVPSQNNNSSNNNSSSSASRPTSSTNRPSTNVDNNTSSESQAPSQEENKYPTTGITADGAETVLSTTDIKNEFTVPTFEKLTFEYSSTKKMRYSLRLPTNYDKDKKYPVLMFLHGINNSGSDWNTLVHLGPLYANNADIVNKAIFVSPQAIDSNDLWSAQKGGNGDIAYELLKKIADEYSVDKNRIYIMGLSMGGIGTWSIIQEHPEFFAAASPICGVGDTMKIEGILNLPIWGWHGTADTTVSYDWWGSTPKMYDAIKNAGGNKMIFSKLDGVGHDAWTPAFSSRDHLSWMFSQVKGKHQSTDYSMVPYLTVVDPDGNVVISEKDATDLETRAGTGKKNSCMDFVFTLDSGATEKLSKAYQKYNGKTFEVYFGNIQIMTFKATNKTDGKYFVIRDVFSDIVYSSYYRRIVSVLGKD